MIKYKFLGPKLYIYILYFCTLYPRSQYYSFGILFHQMFIQVPDLSQGNKPVFHCVRHGQRIAL